MKHVKSYGIFEMAKRHTGDLSPDVIKWLDRHTWRRRKGSTWTLNPQTGLIDINGDFICDKRANGYCLVKLPVAFGVVSGDFDISNHGMTSLEGAPQEVGGNFLCQYSRLTSLKGAPRRVSGSFNCNVNDLESLKGAPQEVGLDFCCAANRLTSLVGAPQKVGGSFICWRNKLRSLKGAPQTLNPYTAFHCEENPLESIEEAPEGNCRFTCDAFDCASFDIEGKLELLTSEPPDHNQYIPIRVHNEELTKKLVLPLIAPERLDAWFRKNPLDLDLLDEFPDVKAGVLQRTGLEDISDLARAMRKGLI